MAKERFFSPLTVFFLYVIVSFLAIFAFRWFFPGAAEPLKIFFFQWRFLDAIITFVDVYPALSLSALVIPFGIREHSDGGYAGSTFVGKKGFSPVFLKYITWPVITASVAAALYGLLCFIALPAAINDKLFMSNRGELYSLAIDKANVHASAGEWAEASQFLAICEGIWPDSDDINELKTKFHSDFSSYYSLSDEIKATPAEDEVSEGEPVNTTEAMAQAEKAFDEERWYDAHWLATLAVRLAKPGSAEIPAAQSLASKAWDKIAEMEPNAYEKERYALFHLKQDGYAAMQAQDWISAYYIFKELSVLTPKDPDIANYLKDCEEGISTLAFFMDEIQLALGTVLHNPVFSLPMTLPLFDGNGNNANTGRMVLRFSSLVLLPDYAYAWDPELIAVDENGLFLYRAQSKYGKIVPITLRTVDDKAEEQSALLMRVLDRTNNQTHWEPVWTNEAGDPLEAAAGTGLPVTVGGPQLLLNLGYDDFLLLARSARGAASLTLQELFSAEKKLSFYGYVPQLFRAEILGRLAEPVFFLPMAVIALFLGWSYRARKKPRYVYLPMLAIMPAVFYGAVLFYRSLLNNISIWLSLSLDFSQALVCFIAGSVVCFILALVCLAAQHG